jgi:hypothetical protein
MHVVQCHPVPHTGALHFGRQGVAHLGKNRLQGLQPGKLLGRGVKRNADNGIHIGTDFKPSYMNFLKFLKIFLKAANISHFQEAHFLLDPDSVPETVSFLTPSNPQAGFRSVDNLLCDY